MPHSHDRLNVSPPPSSLLLISRHDASNRIDECGLGEQVTEEGEEPPHTCTSSSNQPGKKENTVEYNNSNYSSSNINKNNNPDDASTVIGDVPVPVASMATVASATASDVGDLNTSVGIVSPSSSSSSSRYGRGVKKSKYQPLKLRLRAHLTTDQSSNSSSSSNSPKHSLSDDEDHLRVIASIADAEEESAVSSSPSPSPPSSPSSSSLAHVSANHTDVDSAEPPVPQQHVRARSVSKRSISRSRAGSLSASHRAPLEQQQRSDAPALIISTRNLNNLEQHSTLHSPTPGSTTSGNASDNEVSSDDGGAVTPPPISDRHALNADNAPRTPPPPASHYLNFTALSFNNFQALPPSDSAETVAPNLSTFEDGYDPSAPCEDVPPPGQSVSWVSPKLEARTSKTGSGVFAISPIKRGEHLIVWTGRILSAEQALPIMNTTDKHYILQVGDGFYQTPLQKYREPADWTNHSCNPNAGFGKASPIALSAMKDIAVGEEITFDYGMCETDERLWEPMECMCGTEFCRKWITVNDYKIEALWTKYDGFFAPHVQKLVDQLKREKKEREDAAALAAAAATAAAAAAVPASAATVEITTPPTLIVSMTNIDMEKKECNDAPPRPASADPLRLCGPPTVHPSGLLDRVLLSLGVVRSKLLTEQGIIVEKKQRKKTHERGKSL